MWKVTPKGDYFLPSVFDDFPLVTEQDPGTAVFMTIYSSTSVNSINSLTRPLLLLNICPYASIFPQACTSRLCLLKFSHPSRHNECSFIQRGFLDLSVVMKLLPKLPLPSTSNFVCTSTQHESHSNQIIPFFDNTSHVLSMAFRNVLSTE